MTVESLDGVLLLGAAVVLVAVAAVRLSTFSGLPSLLLYLGLGLALGEGGPLHIRFEDNRLTQVLGYSALVLILAEGGLTTRWSDIRESVLPATVLSTLGVAVSVLVIGFAAHHLLSLSWVLALLVGAVLSSTDAAAVFSVLRRVPIHPRLAGILEAESGLNDAPVVLLVVTLAAQAAGEASHSWLDLVGLAVVELVGGGLIGLTVGYLGAAGLRRLALPSSALLSLGVVALAVGAYALAAALNTSGFLAVYVASLVLGNAHLPHRAAVRGFAEALGWLAQIGLFVLLGLLASPSELVGQVPNALLLGLVLLLVARPLSVVASMTPFRLPWRQQAFLSWAGLRGAVPVVLATVPITLKVQGIPWLFNLVFVLVVIFTLVQAPVLPFLARRLRVGNVVDSRDLDLESAPLETLDADAIQVRVGETSRMHGLEIFELRLPPGSNVTLVVRDGASFVPGPRTVLRRGDQLLVVTASSVRRDVQRRLRAVSQGGRLAVWDASAEAAGSAGAGRWGRPARSGSGNSGESARSGSGSARSAESARSAQWAESVRSAESAASAGAHPNLADGLDAEPTRGLSSRLSGRLRRVLARPER
jgi:cell volume regulation protein A